MKSIIKHTDPVLLIGEGELVASVAVCLLKAGHTLDVYTSKREVFSEKFTQYADADRKNSKTDYDLNNYNFRSDIANGKEYKLAVAITPEEGSVKQQVINSLYSVLGDELIIAINTESIALRDLRGTKNIQKLVGLNWSQPAHTTLFLEIISDNDSDAAVNIHELAKTYWGKDPYIVKDSGIRSRLVSAMAREASFLVDNGYATVEDIDRACRNDAGYYLPFSGNCRYMDLMGTYAYGMVMKDLNPDLSKDTAMPQFFTKIIEEGGRGMENGKGFYSYSDEEVANWKQTMEDFSHQIQGIIEKYPFNYKKEPFKD